MDEQPITFRLPKELYEWLRREAFERRNSMNAILVAALSQYRATREDTKEQDQ